MPRASDVTTRQIVDVEMYSERLVVGRLWFRREADGECTRDREVPVGRCCAAMSRRRGRRVRLKVPRAGSEAHSPCGASTHLCARVSGSLCVYIRIDAHIEPSRRAYRRTRFTLSREWPTSFSRDPETSLFPQDWSWRSPYVTKMSSRIITMRFRSRLDYRNRSAIKTKIDTQSLFLTALEKEKIIQP